MSVSTKTLLEHLARSHYEKTAYSRFLAFDVRLHFMWLKVQYAPNCEHRKCTKMDLTCLTIVLKRQNIQDYMFVGDLKARNDHMVAQKSQTS